jgi:hypothetical protein
MWYLNDRPVLHTYSTGGVGVIIAGVGNSVADPTQPFGVIADLSIYGFALGEDAVRSIRASWSAATSNVVAAPVSDLPAPALAIDVNVRTGDLLVTGAAGAVARVVGPRIQHVLNPFGQQGGMLVGSSTAIVVDPPLPLPIEFSIDVFFELPFPGGGEFAALTRSQGPASTPEDGCTYSLHPCVCSLRCPVGMHRYGDGSGCTGGDTPNCDLGWCHSNPNNLPTCDTLSPDWHVIAALGQPGRPLGSFVRGAFVGSGVETDHLAPGWHHLTVVSASDGVRFYVNDEMAVPCIECAISVASDIYMIGNSDVSGVLGLTPAPFGAIYSLRIYGRALTLPEVAALRVVPTPEPVIALDVAGGELVLSGTRAASVAIEEIGSPRVVAGPNTGVADGIEFSAGDTFLLTPFVALGEAFTIDAWFRTTVANQSQPIRTMLHGSQGSRVCDTPHRGFGCDECPDGTETNQLLSPLGWTAGANSQCKLPPGISEVESVGERLCYCHGNMADGDCRNHGSEWYRDTSTGAQKPRILEPALHSRFSA